MIITNPKEIVQFVDYTILDQKQSLSSTLNFINSTKLLEVKPASICTYSSFIDALLNNIVKDVKTCVVSSSFPTGNSTIESDLFDFQFLNTTYVDEVDIVLPYHLTSNLEEATDYLKSSRQALSNKVLKVIVESGQLSTDELNIACQACINAKVDFIKTSTGKIDVGATIEAVEIICNNILNHYNSTKEMIGIKVSGGIRTYDDAMQYINLVSDNLGNEWLAPQYFRIGASSLIKNIL